MLEMLLFILLLIGVVILFYGTEWDNPVVHFSVFFVVFTAGVEIISKSELCSPTLPVMIIEGVFVLIVIVLFTLIIKSYRSVVKKQNKTDADIKKRQRLVRNISYLLALSLTSVPFLLDSWGVNLFPSLKPSEYISYELILADFMESGIKFSFIITIIVFFADNLLCRITSEIYIYDDVRELDKFGLYLRSFNIDKNKEEKLICKMARRLYPVYAIGDPNKVLQPNGAERIYVTDENWQEVVRDLSKRSKFILLRVGQTNGTIWEIKNITNSKLLDKVIFVIYEQDDYVCVSNILREETGIKMPIMKFSINKPIAFYIKKDFDTFIVKQYRIVKKSDVENMLNGFLKDSPELDEKYAEDIELRKHNLKYIFDKSKIPESVRKSLNWGIISPAVNMRHWSFLFWGVFFFLGIISGITESLLPVYAFMFVLLVLGNRIEWAAGGWSCASLFLRHQRREAKYLWLSVFHGYFYSFVYIICFYCFG